MLPPWRAGRWDRVEGCHRSTLSALFEFCTRGEHSLILQNEVDKLKIPRDALAEGNFKGHLAEKLMGLGDPRLPGCGMTAEDIGASLGVLAARGPSALSRPCDRGGSGDSRCRGPGGSGTISEGKTPH